MGRLGGFTCSLCKNRASRANYRRHEKTFHLLCPKCLSLESGTKHPCFGRRLLSKTKAFKLMENNWVDEEMTPTTCGIFVPLELRKDCVDSLRACLAARTFLDNDLFVPALFLLAKLMRTCIACMAAKEGNYAMSEFHSCRMNIQPFLDQNLYLTCLLFNIECNEKSIHFIQSFLEENTFE